MTLEDLKSEIRDVNDFPTKGIIFRDLTTMIKDGEALHLTGEALADLYRGKGVTKVVGIESRGFIGGSILAFGLGCGFVPARKPGKLPAVTVKKAYAKEYGVDTIELHRDAITEDDVVVIHDDLLATGGTMLRPREKHESAKDFHQFHRGIDRSQRPRQSPSRLRGDIPHQILIPAHGRRL